jgi:wobble nucleotide-excising tRNase
MPTPPTLRRIVTLKNLGVFHNFASSAELPDLRRYNLIYGFNGSGKTTLARVFGSLGAGALRLELPEGGTFEVELTDGTVIKSAGALDALKGRVLVFGVDFIEENFRWKEGTANPVFYLGKEQAELSKKLGEEEAAALALEPKRVAAEKRAWLGLGRRYDATNLVADYAKGPCDGLLSDEEQKRLRAVVAQDAPLAKRALMDEEHFNLAGLVDDVRRVLDTTLGAMALEDLRGHETMLRWVKEGEQYHRAHYLASCLLCGGELTEQRLRSLGQAIDGALDRISRDISDAKAKVEALRDRAHGLEKDIPSSHDISKELQLSFTAAAGDLQISLGAGSTAFKALLSLLEKKGRSTQYQGGCGQTSCGSRGSRVGQDGDAAGGGLKCCYRGAQYVLRRIQRGAGQGARN